MRRLALIGLLGVTGCTRHAMLVSDVRIDGYDLVIERCPLTTSSMTGCSIERQPLPIVRSTRTLPARSSARNTHARELVGASDALVPCATQHSLQGVLQVTLEIDHSGHIAKASAEGAPPEFAECGTASLASFPFATSVHGARLTFAWQVPVSAQETP